MSSTPPSKRPKIFSATENNKINSLHSGINCSNGMGTNGELTEIDESLYSRELYVYGTEGMRRMATTNILIIGLDGLGLEIAKNIILSGVKSVTLNDNQVLTVADLSSHFFANKEDIGRERAEICRDQLAELNNHVLVQILKKSTLSVEDFNNFNLVVLTQASEDLCLQYSDICRSISVKLVVANTCGLFGKVFIDFGSEFTVLDQTGADAPFVMIEQIEQTKESIVTCLEEARHDFQNGDVVTFSEIRGMVELNGCKPREVKVIGPHKFSIGDTSTLRPYIGGGICTLVKLPLKMKFESYATAFKSPKFMITDFVKTDRSAQIHLFFKALSDYRLEFNGVLPKPWNEVDARAFLNYVKKVNKYMEGTQAAVESIDENMALLFSCTCIGQCSPIQSIIGSFAAQEVMKACTSKFLPLNQWAYFDAVECLPLEKVSYDGKFVIAELDAKPNGSRYDAQTAIFGRKFQEKLNQLNYFVVGSGAIGCELLKNFALMGVGTGPKGKITITDMDHIERSNLNRQFLFRPWDIGKIKSVIAAVSAKKMNPELNIEAHENRVGGETEKIYDDNFFESLDGVANALDNLEARRYMDRRCVYYRKSLLESGTLGVKGNVQVIIPYLTESYSSSQDPPEKSFPACTLKNFPYLIEHTLQWARDLFEGLFVQQSQTMSTFKQDPLGFIERTLATPGIQPFETLNSLKENLIDKYPQTFEDCVTWARMTCQELYSNTISQLLFNFPSNHMTTTGADFWSGFKRCPHPLEFDVNNSTHMGFVIAAANLRAYSFGITECRDLSKVVAMVQKVNVPLFKPQSGVRIEITEAEGQTRQTGMSPNSSLLDELRKKLTNIKDLSKFKINLIEFEKDNDDNFHIDFIVAASNLRAVNYDIAPADRLKSKMIAGKIIPAIATTTSLICGLVCLELYKLIQGHKTLEFYKNSYIDLGAPFMSFYEPVSPSKAKYCDTEFSIWDRFELSGDMTLQDLLDHFKKNLNLSITMLSQDVSMLYASFMFDVKRKERLVMSLRQLVETVSKHKIPSYVNALVFDVCCSDENNNDVDVPYIRYTLS